MTTLRFLRSKLRNSGCYSSTPKYRTKTPHSEMSSVLFSMSSLPSKRRVPGINQAGAIVTDKLLETLSPPPDTVIIATIIKQVDTADNTLSLLSRQGATRCVG